MDEVQVQTPEEEWRRFLAARQHVDEELAQLSQFSNPLIADIFLVHREILHDKTLTDSVQGAIEAGADAATATQQATTELVRLFQSLSDSYFANRAADIRDVGQRLLTHLGGISLAQQLAHLPKDTVLIAEDLTPFDTTHLSSEHVSGIALAGSAPTAHTAILARSLGLPLVCGLGPSILQLSSNQAAVVDGVRGRLIVAPEEETLEAYRDTQERMLQFRTAAEARSREPAISKDGHRYPVRANINSKEDIVLASSAGADGVGLLRTEYLFQHRTAPPSVQEQLEAYQAIARYFPDQPLTIRLLDIGGDKPVQYLPQPAEFNPFLGVRGIRLLLQHPQLLRDQIQALVDLALDPALTEPVRMLVPMVSKISELYRTLSIYDEIPNAKRARESGQLQLGVMIEVPAAALLADRLASLVDFFSIGTNDLEQYTLAADRSNSAVAGLATSLDPSVLKLIAMTCQAGRKANFPVAICGEIAGDPSAVPLLLGLGITEVSAVAPAIPLVKQAIRRIDLEESRQLSQKSLLCSRAQDVLKLLSLA